MAVIGAAIGVAAVGSDLHGGNEVIHERFPTIMTEDCKEELKQLLLEAEPAINVQYISEPRGNVPRLPRDINEYKTLLQQDYISLDNYSIVRECVPYLVDKNIRRKMFDFLRRQFSDFMLPEHSAVESHTPSGKIPTNVDWILRRLLQIFLTSGTEKVIQVIDRYTEDNRASYQMVVCIDGITLDYRQPKAIYPNSSRTWERPTEIQVFPGIKLVSIHGDVSSLPRHLRNLYSPVYQCDFINKTDFVNKLMIIVDYSISPILLPHGGDVTQTCKVNDDNYPNLNAKLNSKAPFANQGLHNALFKFVDDFCRVLSLHYNCAIWRSYYFDLVPEDELYGALLNDNVTIINAFDRDAGIRVRGGKNIEFSETKTGQRGAAEIEKVKNRYEVFASLDSEVQDKLKIPVDRWIKSKATSGFADRMQHVDRIIDLAIAFESIYLSDTDNRSELAHRLQLHAAWYLGKDKDDRQALMNEFKKIYSWRSRAVHSGSLPKKKRNVLFTYEEVANVLAKAEDLCRDSILKIIEDGKFPDWGELILGE